MKTWNCIFVFIFLLIIHGYLTKLEFLDDTIKARDILTWISIFNVAWVVCFLVFFLPQAHPASYRSILTGNASNVSKRAPYLNSTCWSIDLYLFQDALFVQATVIAWTTTKFLGGMAVLSVPKGAATWKDSYGRSTRLKVSKVSWRIKQEARETTHSRFLIWAFPNPAPHVALAITGLLL